MKVQGIRVQVQAFVTEKVTDGTDVVMGMDVIKQLGEVTFVKKTNCVRGTVCHS